MRSKQTLARDIGRAFHAESASGRGRARLEVSVTSHAPFAARLPFHIGSIRQIDGELHEVTLVCEIDCGPYFGRRARDNKLRTTAQVIIPLRYPNGSIKVLNWGSPEILDGKHDAQEGLYGRDYQKELERLSFYYKTPDSTEPLFKPARTLNAVAPSRDMHALLLLRSRPDPENSWEVTKDWGSPRQFLAALRHGKAGKFDHADSAHLVRRGVRNQYPFIFP